MLIKKHKIVFVHIPKTAGSSIERSLKPYRDLRHLLIRRANKTLQSLRINSRIQGIDERTHALATEYAELLGASFETYFSFAIVRNPFDRMVSSYEFTKKRTQLKDSFKEFVLSSSKKILLPQSDFVVDQNGEVMLSFVGKFETLSGDLEYISKKTGLVLDLPHLNKTKHEHFSSYYDEETRMAVVDFYQNDFELFGYSKIINLESGNCVT
jgi:hypothetical protein